jgi:AcrR family transcriptional regulator
MAIVELPYCAPIENHAPQTLRRVQQQLTRTRLLDAAAGLIARKGYAATTIDEIATVAGATRATFYLHFEAKSELARDLRDMLGAFDPDHRELLAVARSPSVQALSRWLSEYIEHVSRRPDHAAALRSATDADPAIRKTTQAIHDRSTEALADGLADARNWPPDHARIVAGIFLRQLDITSDPAVESADETERDALCIILATMWLSALLAGPDADG